MSFELAFSLIIISIILVSPLTWTIFSRSIEKIISLFKKQTTEEEKISVIQDITAALVSLQETKKGATIIIDHNGDTADYILDPEYIDARLTSNLIINIFEGSKTPLHDGAVVVSGTRVESASSYISVLSKKKLPKSFGTRHRSALGISEKTKAIIIVLSEESRKITVFYKGKYEVVNTKDLFDYIISLWFVW